MNNWTSNMEICREMVQIKREIGITNANSTTNIRSHNIIVREREREKTNTLNFGLKPFCECVRERAHAWWSGILRTQLRKSYYILYVHIPTLFLSKRNGHFGECVWCGYNVRQSPSLYRFLTLVFRFIHISIVLSRCVCVFCLFCIIMTS